MITVSVYSPNSRPPTHVEQLLIDLREDADSITVRVVDLNTLVSSMDKPTNKKLNQGTTQLTIP